MGLNKVLTFTKRLLKEKKLVKAYLKGEITKKELEKYNIKLKNPI